MPSDMILIDRSPDTDPVLRLTVVFWLSTPPGQVTQFANPQATSRVADITAQELADIRAGRVVERVVTLSWAEAALSDAEIEERLTAYQRSLVREVFGTVGRGRFWRRGMRRDALTRQWMGGQE